MVVPSVDRWWGEREGGDSDKKKGWGEKERSDRVEIYEMKLGCGVELRCAWVYFNLIQLIYLTDELLSDFFKERALC